MARFSLIDSRSIPSICGVMLTPRLLRSTDRGIFNTVNAQRSDVTVSFDDIFYLRPRIITVADGSTEMIPITHELLSQYVGTSREIIARN